MLRENLFIHIPRTGGKFVKITLAKDAKEFPNSFLHSHIPV